MQKCGSTSFQDLMNDLENVYFVGKDMNCRKFEKYIDKNIFETIYTDILSASTFLYDKTKPPEVFKNI